MQFPPPEYSYGAVVQLCEGTDVLLLLAAVSSGIVYYDPAIKVRHQEPQSPSSNVEASSEFTMTHYQASIEIQTLRPYCLPTS